MTAPWRTIGEMQARDLLRRRAALLLMAALPLSWYAAEAASGVDYAVGTGVLGMAWSAAAAPLFAVLAARNVDQRLVQNGYRASDIVKGRLAALLAISTVMALLFGVIMVAGSRPDRPADLFLALLLTTLVSTPVGWLIAALVPRELEGTLLLIALVGLQISIPVGGPEWLVPYWAPLRLTDYTREPIAGGLPTLHAIGWSVLIGAIAITVWRRRVVIHAAMPESAPASN